ncbi:helix-turn-helix domain-containing protein [Paenibacillus sinopodophylli]|uniref:helix-turn-helix domain-containing protein n=1 Tax=Paenibacillus sinopodophylli TaxID=1837342 RepID=UPI00110CE5C0|nr:helix-turn-helix domain-containing protein [Paenibacillus sinopodophylli]
MNHTMFVLSSIHEYRRTTRFSILHKPISFYVLGFITKGSGELILDQKSHSINALQPFFLTPGMNVSFLSQSDELDYILLLLEPVTLQRSKRQWLLSAQPELPTALKQLGVPLRNEVQYREKLVQLLQAARKPRHEPMLQTRFQLLFNEVLYELLSHEQETERDAGMQDSLRYIHSHLHKKMELSTLADIAMLTPTSYSRKFKRLHGVSPIDYVNFIRIEEAKKQLSAGHATIREISARVGFNSEFYFSKVFKKMVGIAPALYIKRHHLTVATVACNHYDDILRSLQIEPVLTVNSYPYPGMDEQKLKIRLAGQLQQLAALKPDLIIIDRYHRHLYPALQLISPTICIDYDSDWKVTYLKISELLGLELKARAVLNLLEARAIDVQKQLSRRFGNGSLALMRVTPDTVRIIGAPEHPLNDLIYNQLGITAGSSSPVIDRKLELPPGQLSTISMQSDYLFIQKHFFETNNDNALQQMQHSTFWQTHEAVRNNGIRYIPNWFAMSWTPLGRHRIMDSLLSLNDEAK